MSRKRSSGGRGGNAHVEGNNSFAEGGQGGPAVIGDGGAGGDASVFGDNAIAIGGKGGRGGIGNGSKGGDAHILKEEADRAIAMIKIGGQGGEAGQADGRGGRGGRAGRTDRKHMRWPYFEPITEPGRGGDGPDTSQYMARRLILEMLKKQYFRANGLPIANVWWDREVVPLSWLNEQLRAQRHRWQVVIVDDEYEFSDLPKSL